MYIPDRAIERKLQEYDSRLFLRWNESRRYFELWRKMENTKTVCVTPITQSLYDAHKPVKFIELDERLLWWVYDSDGWRQGGSKKYALAADQRWIDWNSKRDQKNRQLWYDAGKDAASFATNFFTKKHTPKNPGRPSFSNANSYVSYVRPTSRSGSAPRAFSLTPDEARRHGWRR